MKTQLQVFDSMTSNLRGNGSWASIKHFIVERNRLQPRSFGKNISGDANYITQFCKGKLSDGTWAIFGWGIDGSNTGAWYKYNEGDDSWITLGSSSASVGSRNDNIAFHFEGKLYGYGAQKLSKCVPGTSFDANWTTTGTSWVSVAEPTIVGANAYFAMDNIVYELATGATTLTTKYTLSPDRLITSLCATGSSLSVMTYHTGNQNSREFIFNVAGTDTNAIDSIDWGSGKAKLHEEVRGVIMAVIDERTNIAGDSNEASIKFKRRSGSQIVTDAELKAITSANAIGATKKVFEDKLCFKLAFTNSDGDAVSGIFSYSTEGNFVIEHTIEFGSATYPNLGFIQFNNSWLVAHSASGSTTKVWVTAGFSGSSGTTYYDGELITKIINHEDTMISKQIVGVSVSFVPLVSGQQVRLYYRIVGGAWTLIKTENTVGANRLSISGAGSSISQYREIQFKILSTKAVITGFKEVSVVVKDESYDTQ